MTLKVYIGHDPREGPAFAVAARSARKFGCDVIPLREETLRLSGMLTRPTDTRGQMWDFNSGAPQSTAFAIARFFAPVLAHSGWCLFVDADVIFLRDPNELFEVADPACAVMVVKHKPMQLGTVKMDGQVQTSYARKLWSSVVLWNVDHPANSRLNLQMLNQWPGRDLHAFRWLADSEIGELAPEWNWLVGMQDKPASPAIAHYTLGTPDMAGHENDPHSELWKQRASEK
jgi:lipopolysaccharide biosynthesis glycosyltransferase